MPLALINQLNEWILNGFTYRIRCCSLSTLKWDARLFVIFQRSFISIGWRYSFHETNVLHIIQLFVYNSSKEFVRHVPGDKIFTIKSEKAVRIGLQTMSSSEHERMRYKRTERCKIYRSHVYHRIVSIKGVSLHIKCQYVVCGCIEMYSYGSDLLSSDGCDFGAHTMCKICTVINFSQFKSTLFF